MMSPFQEWIDEVRHEIQSVIDNIDSNQRFFLDEMSEKHTAGLEIIRSTLDLHFKILSKWFMECDK